MLSNHGSKNSRLGIHITCSFCSQRNCDQNQHSAAQSVQRTMRRLHTPTSCSKTLIHIASQVLRSSIKNVNSLAKHDHWQDRQKPLGSSSDASGSGRKAMKFAHPEIRPWHDKIAFGSMLHDVCIHPRHIQAYSLALVRSDPNESNMLSQILFRSLQSVSSRMSVCAREFVYVCHSV